MRIELYISEEIVAEVRGVLARPRLRRKFPSLTDQSTSPGIPRTSRTSIGRIAAKANCFVSRDKDLLDLADASSPDREQIRRGAPDLRIFEPGALLEEVRRGQITSPA